MDTNSRGWWQPLSGLVLVVVGVIAVVVTGDTPDPTDDSAREIARYYQDNEATGGLSVSLAVVVAALMVHFGAVVRAALRAAQPDPAGDLAPAVAFAGAIVFATGLAVDATIEITLLETSDDISPAAVQALSALYANDFIPFALGLLLFLMGTGVAVVRHGALPKWLGWVIIVLGALCATPIGFVGFIGGLIMIAAISIRLTVIARRASADPAIAA